MVVLVIVLVLAALALLLLVWTGIRDRVRQQERVQEEAESVPTLDYEVPEGQDPAVLMVALRQEGYQATAVDAGRHQHLLVPCPEGAERERARVRAVLQSATVSALDDGVPLRQEVRFTDE